MRIATTRGIAFALSLAAGSFLLAKTVNAQTTFVWQGVNGSWTATADWSPAGPPDGIDNTIGSINASGTRTMTLDGNHTIGNINWTVNNNRIFNINRWRKSCCVKA